MEKTKELFKLLKQGRWDEGETLWLEVIDDGIKEVSPLQEAAHELARRGQREMALELLKLSTEACASSEDPSLWVDMLRVLAEYNPTDKKIIGNFAEAFQRLYADRPYLAQWIKEVKKEDHTPRSFIKVLDKLVLFQEGSFVKHKSGWGIGKVTKVSEKRMEMIVDLEKRSDHRMDTLAAADCLTPMPADHFEVLAALSPEKLREEAEKEPLQLIYRVLRYLGNAANARKIKQNLFPNIISEDKWSKWWTKVRKLMGKDPYLELSEQGLYSLREQPRDLEDEFFQGFEKAHMLDFPSLVLDYLKNSTQKKHLDYCSEKLQELYKIHYEKEPWYAVESYLILTNTLKQKSLDIDIKEIWEKDFLAVFKNIRLTSLAQQTLESFIDTNTDWEKHIGSILVKGSELSRDTLFKQLKKKRLLSKYASQIFDEIMAQRLNFPDSFVWFSKQALNNRFPKDILPGFFAVFDIIHQTLTTLNSLRRLQQEYVKKIFTASLVDKIIANIDEEKAIETLILIERTNWYPSRFVESLKQQAEAKFPEIFSTVEPIYSTEEGLEKYEEELRELLENKIPENSEAIGHALSFGDISENAELDAARELQFQLMKKAKEMQENIVRVKIIEDASIGLEKVGIGTTVKLENSGETTEYTILGPWDVNLERNVVSYLSPIAQNLIDSGKGDSVDLSGETYQITDISKYSLEH